MMVIEKWEKRSQHLNGIKQSQTNWLAVSVVIISVELRAETRIAFLVEFDANKQKQRSKTAFDRPSGSRKMLIEIEFALKSWQQKRKSKVSQSSFNARTDIYLRVVQFRLNDFATKFKAWRKKATFILNVSESVPSGTRTAQARFEKLWEITDAEISLCIISPPLSEDKCLWFSVWNFLIGKQTKTVSQPDSKKNLINTFCVPH